MTTTVEETDLLATNLATLPQYRTRNRPGGLAEEAVASLLSVNEGLESTNRVLLVHTNQPHGHMWTVDAERVRQQPALRPFVGAYGWFIGGTDTYLAARISEGTGTITGTPASPLDVLAASVQQWRVTTRLNDYLTRDRVVPFIRESRGGRIGVALAPPDERTARGMWLVDSERIRNTPALAPFEGWRGQWCYDYEVAFVSERGEVNVTPTGGIDLSPVPEQYRAAVPEGAYWIRTTGYDRAPAGEYLAIEHDSGFHTIMLWPGHTFTGGGRGGIPDGWTGYYVATNRAERIERVAPTPEPTPETWRPANGARCVVLTDYDEPRNNGLATGTIVQYRDDGGTHSIRVRFDVVDGVDHPFGMSRNSGEYGWWVHEVGPIPVDEPEPEFDRLAVGNWYSWGTRGRWYRLAGLTDTGARMRVDAYAANEGEMVSPYSDTTLMPFASGRDREVSYGPTVGSDGTPTPDWIRAFFPTAEDEATGTWLDDYPVGHFFTLGGAHAGEVFVVSAHRDGMVEYTARPEDQCGTGLWDEPVMRTSAPYVDPTASAAPAAPAFTVDQQVHVDYPSWEGDGRIVDVNRNSVEVLMTTGSFSGRRGTFMNEHVTLLRTDLSSVPEEYRSLIPATARWMEDSGTMAGTPMLVIEDPCHSGGSNRMGLLWPGHPRWNDAYAEDRTSCGVPSGWRGWRTAGWREVPAPVVAPVPEESEAEVMIDFPIATYRHLVPSDARMVRLLDAGVDNHPAGTYVGILREGTNRWTLVSEPGMLQYRSSGHRDYLPEPLHGYRLARHRTVEDLGPVPAPATLPTTTTEDYPFPEIPEVDRATAPNGLVRVRVNDSFDGGVLVPGETYLAVRHLERPDHHVIALWPGHRLHGRGNNRSAQGVPLPWRGYTLRDASITVVTEPVDSVEALRARLAQVEREYAEDLQTIARMMNEQARRREWCEEYEEVMARINRETHGDFSMAQRPVRIVAAYRVAGFMTGNADVEVPQSYSPDDVRRAVHTMLTTRGRIDTTSGTIDMSAVTLENVVIDNYDERD